jgi:hypothetical protein
MPRFMMMLFNILFLLLLTGCSKENLIQGMYDGVRTHNDLQSTPLERAGKPDSPDYLEYERMRKEQSHRKE